MMGLSTDEQPLSPAGVGLSWVDTHCHLDFPDYRDDLVAVLERSHSVGVNTIITVGTELATSRRAVELAAAGEKVRGGPQIVTIQLKPGVTVQQCPGLGQADRRRAVLGTQARPIAPRRGAAGQLPQIYATVGVHPHHVNELVEGDYRRLRELALSPGVVAYGEIGLDYLKEYSPAPMQRDHFAAQVELAVELGLPLIIHDREAHSDTLAILREAGKLPAGGVMHCFSGDAALAEEVLELGFYISITGVVTFKTATTLREAVARTPLERLLLETDGPFLAPVPYRGKRNEPAHIPLIAARVAEIKGCSIAEIAQATTANARRLFNL